MHKRGHIYFALTQLKKILTFGKSESKLLKNRNDSETLMINKERFIKEMMEKGLKLTSQRLGIIDFLIEKAPIHPGASLIYEQVRKKVKSLSLSTVYLTLSEFSKHGLIKILEFDKMENRCEANRDMHVNLICKGCNKIVDYNRSPIDPDEILKKARFMVIDTRLEYYGFCEQCIKRQAVYKKVRKKEGK